MKSKLLTYAEEYLENFNSLLEENNLDYPIPTVTYDDFWEEVIVKYSERFILYVQDIDEVILMANGEEFIDLPYEELLREWKRVM